MGEGISLAFCTMGYVVALLACLAMSVVSGTEEHFPGQVSGAAPEQLFPERDVKSARKEGHAQGRDETLKLLCDGQPSFGKCAQLLGNPLQVGEGLAAASGGRRETPTPAQEKKKKEKEEEERAGKEEEREGKEDQERE